MKEREIQSTFIDEVILKELSDQAILCAEMKYSEGKRIADLAIIDKKKITCYEIKSKHDSLKKLPFQINSYYESFDYIYVIVDLKHLSAVEKIIHETTGVYLIQEKKIKLIKKAKKNYDQTKNGLLSFLTKKELINLEWDKKKVPISSPKEAIKTAIENHQTKEKIKDYVISALEQKYSSRYQEFLRERGHVTIDEDLYLLTGNNNYLTSHKH